MCDKMKKTRKLFWKAAGAILCGAGVLLGALVLYVVLTPHPAVWLLRNAFHEQAQIENVANYEDIKKNVVIHKDLVYPSADEKNAYDIYLPKGAHQPLPTIVWVHGGAFVAGTKDGIENYAVMLANAGYAVVGVDYQWAPEIRYPGQVRQVQECLAQLSEVQEQYHLDLDRIVLFGDSAGAHIAAQAALLAVNPEYVKAIGASSSIRSQQLKGAVLYCGPYDVSKMLDTGSKELDFFTSRIGWALMGEKNRKDGKMIRTTTIKDYVTADFPPVLISDGNTGSFESQGKELAEHLGQKGVAVTALFFEKEDYGEVGHEYQFSIAGGGAGTLCYEATLHFLSEILQ